MSARSNILAFRSSLVAEPDALELFETVADASTKLALISQSILYAVKRNPDTKCSSHRAEVRKVIASLMVDVNAVGDGPDIDGAIS